MLQETNTSTTEIPGGDLLEVARDLESARRALEAIEARVPAGVAEALAGARYGGHWRLEAMSPDEWMTAEEAAAYLKRTPKAFEKIASKGEIPKHYLTERGILFSCK